MTDRTKRETDGEVLTVRVKKRTIVVALTVLLSPGGLALWKSLDNGGDLRAVAEAATSSDAEAMRRARVASATSDMTADQCQAGYLATREKIDQLAADFLALKTDLIYQGTRIDRVLAAQPVTQRRYRAPRRPAPEDVPVSPVVAAPLPPTLADAAKEAQ